VADQHQIKRHAPADLFRYGNEDGCHIIPVTLICGARDKFSSHTPTTDIRAGVILGKRAADNKYGPMIRHTLSAAEAIGQTVLSMNSTEGFAVGDNVYIRTSAWATEQDLGALTAVATTTITVTNALSNNYAAGDYVYLSNGLGQAKCVLADNTTVVDENASDLAAPQARSIWRTYNASLLSGAIPNIDDRAIEEMDGDAAAEADIDFGP